MQDDQDNVRHINEAKHKVEPPQDPHITDVLFRSTINDIDRMQNEVNELQDEMSKQMFAANGQRRVAECGAKIMRLTLSRLMDNQIIIMHVLHRLMFPNTPPLLVVTPIQKQPDATQ